MSGLVPRSARKSRGMPCLRRLVRVRRAKYEAGPLDDGAALEDAMRAYEAGIAGRERLIGR